MRKALRDNGLSLVLLLLFLFSIAGQSIVGLAHFNGELRQHGQPAITYLAYVTSPGFAESVFENWESEFLQMAVYVMLTALLYQRGSAESRDPDQPGDTEAELRAHASDPNAPYPVRAGGWRLKLYQYSLSLALFLLFAGSFTLHLVSSAREHCRDQLIHGGPCGTVFAHLWDATFWFESLQNWQSEFLSVAVLVVLSIFLRHKGSPESKPLCAAHAETGR